MEIGLSSDGLGMLSLEACLDKMAELGMTAVEFSLGGWSPAPHIKIDEMLGSASARDELLGECSSRGIQISALNCSGNQLHTNETGPASAQLARKTLELASLLKVNRVVMMSGLPPGPGDSHPNWITSSWPPETREILEWQWNERIIPFWKNFVPEAERYGIRICIEQHGRQAVYNNESFFRLREATGPTIGVNFDPSHLIWMGGDPIAAIRDLGGCIYHVHGKDTYIEDVARKNGLLDPKWVIPVEGRAWNYTSLGHGQSVGKWLNILQELKDVGYDDVISIENEDYTLDACSAISASTSVLRFCIDRTGTKPSSDA